MCVLYFILYTNFNKFSVEKGKNMKNVQQLRQEGFKVRICHERYYYDPFNQWADLLPRHEVEVELYDVMNPEPKGGRTIVELTDPTGKTVKGIAECSEKDNYQRKLGVKIAIARALKLLEEKE